MASDALHSYGWGSTDNYGAEAVVLAAREEEADDTKARASSGSTKPTASFHPRLTELGPYVTPESVRVAPIPHFGPSLPQPPPQPPPPHQPSHIYTFPSQKPNPLNYQYPFHGTSHHTAFGKQSLPHHQQFHHHRFQDQHAANPFHPNQHQQQIAIEIPSSSTAASPYNYYQAATETRNPFESDTSVPKTTLPSVHRPLPLVPSAHLSFAHKDSLSAQRVHRRADVVRERRYTLPALEFIGLLWLVVVFISSGILQEDFVFSSPWALQVLWHAAYAFFPGYRPVFIYVIGVMFDITCVVWHSVAHGDQYDHPHHRTGFLVRLAYTAVFTMIHFAHVWRAYRQVEPDALDDLIQLVEDVGVSSASNHSSSSDSQSTLLAPVHPAQSSSLMTSITPFVDCSEPTTMRKITNVLLFPAWLVLRVLYYAGYATCFVFCCGFCCRRGNNVIRPSKVHIK